MEEMTQDTKATAAEKQGNSEKTFTQDEVNAIVQKRLAAEKGKAKGDDGVDQRIKELNERENALVLSERKFAAKQALTEKGLSTELVGFLDYSTDESFNESIDKLEQIIKEARLNDQEGGVRIDTGLDHGDSRNDDAFTRAFKE